MDREWSEQEILTRVDHTLLKPESTWTQIRQICDEAVEYHCASVCIPPAFVESCYHYLKGKIPVCTVIGFPNGNCTSETKVQESMQAVFEGAAELDMVANIGWIKEQRWNKVGGEILAVREVCPDQILKVIVETCLLTEEEKIAMCRIITETGADYIKTSTGFSTGGATPEDVALFREYVGPGVKIKAAGGIASVEDAKNLLNQGADRLGTSRMIRLLHPADLDRQ